jgi:hypothetical protein
MHSSSQKSAIELINNIFNPVARKGTVAMFQQKLLDSAANDSNNKSRVQVYFNGLCQPCNLGRTACFAFIVKNKENIIRSEYGLAAYDTTNNVAEILALSEH